VTAHQRNAVEYAAKTKTGELAAEITAAERITGAILILARSSKSEQGNPNVS
jgi:hypothetical protein